MFRKIALTLAAVALLAGAAAADPIEGDWKTQSGATAAITGCGGGFCIRMKTGKYKGKSIGQMSAAGSAQYSGSITDPASDKTYSGDASLSGTSMKMRGCVLGGLICKTQVWTKL